MPHIDAPLTVDTIDVYPDAFTITGKELPALVAGSTLYLFDVFGRRHPINRVRALKSGKFRTYRDGGWNDTFGADEVFTVTRRATPPTS